MNNRLIIRGVASQFLLILFVSFLVAYGCGGGGGGGGGTTASQGIFEDSIVEGVEYQTASQSGVTDSNGIFEYQNGETVTFSIGDIILGQAPAKEWMTPIDLVAGAVGPTDATVTNICRFLMTLDDDDNPDNGIVIVESVRQDAKGRSVDFSLSVTDFENDPGVQQVLDSLTALTSAGQRSLCPASEAQDHLGNLYPSVNPQTLTLAAGGIATATITGGCSPYASSSNNSSVATVSVNGNTVTVNGVAEGTATITITDAHKNSVTLPVTVSAGAELRWVLKYATNVSGSWVTVPIVNGYEGDVEHVGEYTSLAIDSNNRLHISYYDPGYGDLKYVTNVSGSWVTYTIDSGGDVGRFSSIAIDSTNKVHISYLDYTNFDLKYATNASGSWMIFTIDSGGDVGWWDTSIAIDSTNKVHISYHDNTNLDLKYATNVSGSWVTATIDSDGSTGWHTSIAIDSNDKVHISYVDQWIGLHGNYGYYVICTTNAGGPWVRDEIEMQYWNIVEFTSIAIDSNNKAHISYVYDYYYDLTYATNASGSWEYSSIDTSAGPYGSIAIDSNDKVHISYYDVDP